MKKQTAKPSRQNLSAVLAVLELHSRIYKLGHKNSRFCQKFYERPMRNKETKMRRQNLWLLIPGLVIATLSAVSPAYSVPCGEPAFIQSTYGPSPPYGNFELVVPLCTGGLAHYYRENNPVGPWIQSAVFGGGASYTAAALIQSNLGPGPNGNLEVIASDSAGQLWSFYREDGSFEWNGPIPVAGGGRKSAGYGQSEIGRSAQTGNV